MTGFVCRWCWGTDRHTVTCPVPKDKTASIWVVPAAKKRRP